MTAPMWTWLGLDASVWQTIIGAVAALGTVGAAVVALIALRYFKSQTEAMQASNEANRLQMDAQERRWEEEQRREKKREHALIRPVIQLTLMDGRIHPADECGMGLAFDRGRAVRDATISVAFDGDEVAAECVPPGWPEIGFGTSVQFLVRAPAVAKDDRGTLRVTYLDALGSRVTSDFPLRVTDVEHLAFARNLELAMTTTDDL